MIRHTLCALPLLLLLAVLLGSCIHYVPREQDSETSGHTTQTTATEPQVDSTTKPTEETTEPIEEPGFPNEAEPNGTKRY